MIAIAAKHYGKEVIVSVTSAPDGVKEVSRSIKITDDLMVFFTGESIDFDQCAKMLTSAVTSGLSRISEEEMKAAGSRSGWLTALAVVKKDGKVILYHLAPNCTFIPVDEYKYVTGGRFYQEARGAMQVGAGPAKAVEACHALADAVNKYRIQTTIVSA